MDIKERIEELETELSLAKTIMFSKKGAVDIKKCEEIVFDIKRNLPSAIQEASYLISQKDKIIFTANQEAEKIKAEALNYSKHLVEDSEIVKKSEEMAKDNMDYAEKYCNSLYSNTKDNIDKLLKHVEDYLMENLHIVRNNREELAGKILQKNPDKK